ncbi:hypothetical protein ACN4FH_26920, partial [Klebsiella pneumoniae]|uniref:hypothetical protein n=1 Tax=Klebsiella pneumoniae TaxID=573 RepID=UPI003AF88C46
MLNVQTPWAPIEAYITHVAQPGRRDVSASTELHNGYRAIPVCGIIPFQYALYTKFIEIKAARTEMHFPANQAVCPENSF